MKYRLKTHEVEAIRWTGTKKCQQEITTLVAPAEVKRHLNTLDIHMDGGRKLNLFQNDWIVHRDGTIAIYGERIFLEHYEEVT